MPAQQLERLLEPEPVLVLDVVGVEVGVVVVDDGRLELCFEPVRDRAQGTVAGDKREVPLEPLLFEGKFNLAGVFFVR